MSNLHSPLLALPQELRDAILSYLLLPATWTTEHPFAECMPTASRFHPYLALSLVNRTLHEDIKAYFTEHIAPHLTFYFATLPTLSRFQSLALRTTLLQNANFHLRCGSGANPSPTSHLQGSRHTGAEYQTTRQKEACEALIRIQPGFTPKTRHVPDFYRSQPAPGTYRDVVTNWKPRKHGIFVTQQTGGEICLSPTCPLLSRRTLGEVTEVHHPPLNQGTWTAEVPEGNLAPGQKGALRLACYIWTKPVAQPPIRSRAEVADMVLTGKLRDVWVREDAVAVCLAQQRRREVRMMGKAGTGWADA